jgi:hypothetical protein
MKTKIFWVLIPVVLFWGCKTTQVVESIPPQEVPKEEVNNYQKWNPEIQQKLESLGVDPSKISFFNSSDINMNQNLVKQVVEVIEGEVFLTDSVFHIEKTIEKLTLGVLREKSKQPTSPVTIPFSDLDKSYQMTFGYSKEENAFILAGSAIFSFRGIDYKINPKTNEKCYLLFSMKKEKVTTEIKENAEGVPQK